MCELPARPRPHTRLCGSSCGAPATTYSSTCDLPQDGLDYRLAHAGDQAPSVQRPRHVGLVGVFPLVRLEVFLMASRGRGSCCPRIGIVLSLVSEGFLVSCPSGRSTGSASSIPVQQWRAPIGRRLSSWVISGESGHSCEITRFV